MRQLLFGSFAVTIGCEGSRFDGATKAAPGGQRCWVAMLRFIDEHGHPGALGSVAPSRPEIKSALLARTQLLGRCTQRAL